MNAFTIMQNLVSFYFMFQTSSNILFVYSDRCYFSEQEYVYIYFILQIQD